jgi:hypothetical protein
MSATTKIYRVVTYDDFPRHYHFATKQEALIFVQEWRKDLPEYSKASEPDIGVVVIKLNARGIAEALDDVISMTCMNEG